MRIFANRNVLAQVPAKAAIPLHGHFPEWSPLACKDTWLQHARRPLSRFTRHAKAIGRRSPMSTEVCKPLWRAMTSSWSSQNKLLPKPKKQGQPEKVILNRETRSTWKGQPKQSKSELNWSTWKGHQCKIKQKGATINSQPNRQLALPLLNVPKMFSANERDWSLRRLIEFPEN